MRNNKGGGPLSKWSNWRILWILILFVAVAAAGMTISQQLLLDNARTMGKNLVTSYSNDENNQLSEYDRILTMAMYYMEGMRLGRWTRRGRIPGKAELAVTLKSEDLPAMCAMRPRGIGWRGMRVERARSVPRKE